MDNELMQRFQTAALSALVLLLLSLVLAGCEVGVSSNSPYNGRWIGTWYNSTTSDGGSIDMKISVNGVITGSVSSGSSIYGTVYDNGTMSYSYTNTATSENHLITGKMSMKNGDLSVSATESINSGLGSSLSMTLKPN